MNVSIEMIFRNSPDLRLAKALIKRNVTRLAQQHDAMSFCSVEIDWPQAGEECYRLQILVTLSGRQIFEGIHHPGQESEAHMRAAIEKAFHAMGQRLQREETPMAGPGLQAIEARN